jgi:hypothetical protein
LVVAGAKFGVSKMWQRGIAPGFRHFCFAANPRDRALAPFCDYLISSFVIPAKAGIHAEFAIATGFVDPRFRGDDRDIIWAVSLFKRFAH